MHGCVVQDGSTMLMEAAKGGHFETMSLLLDWPVSSAASHTGTSTDAGSHANKVVAASCTAPCLELIARLKLYLTASTLRQGVLVHKLILTLSVSYFSDCSKTSLPNRSGPYRSNPPFF